LGRTAPRARATPDALARGRRARPRAHGAVAARRAARVIAMLSGVVRKKLEDRIVLECGGVGYEVFLPPITIAQLEHVTAGRGDKASELELVVYYHATRDQPRPALIGFTSDLDKEFFEKLITVKQLGHRPSEASQLITDALRRRPSITTPEELFDEIYRGQKA